MFLRVGRRHSHGYFFPQGFWSPRLLRDVPQFLFEAMAISFFILGGITPYIASRDS